MAEAWAHAGTSRRQAISVGLSVFIKFEKLTLVKELAGIGVMGGDHKDFGVPSLQATEQPQFQVYLEEGPSHAEAG